VDLFWKTGPQDPYDVPEAPPPPDFDGEALEKLEEAAWTGALDAMAKELPEEELPKLEPLSARCIASKPAFLANGSDVRATQEEAVSMLLFSP